MNSDSATATGNSSGHGNISIVVPTFNRPEMLQKSLAFLQHQSRQVSIIVADGSPTSGNSNLNSQICEAAGKNVRYFHSPSPADPSEQINNYYQRMLCALDMAATPYVVCMADDDLLVIKATFEAAHFLDENIDYIACHGTFLGFEYAARGIRINGFASRPASLDGARIEDRLVQLFSNYEPIVYAVFRTPVLR